MFLYFFTGRHEVGFEICNKLYILFTVQIIRHFTTKTNLYLTENMLI